MLVIKKNFNQGYVKLKISLLDDLWYLSHLILPGDLITSKTERKIKIGDVTAGRTSVVRKTITLQLTVIGTELEQGGILRVKGTVARGTDDVPLGAHHSFGLSLNDEFSLEKKSWPAYLKDKLADAVANTAQQLLVVVFDREKALFSEITQQGIKHVAELKSEVQNKQYATDASSSVISEIIHELQEQVKRKSFETIIVGSPGFWHAPFKKLLPDALQKKVVLVTAYGAEKSVVGQLLARPELKSLVANQRVTKEQAIVEEVLTSLAKDKVAYGFEDVSVAAQNGAVLSLILTNEYIENAKQQATYDVVDQLLQTVDTTRGKIHILYDDATAKTIDGLGGVVAILRWKNAV
jgi:protein pelota